MIRLPIGDSEMSEFTATLEALMETCKRLGSWNTAWMVRGAIYLGLQVAERAGASRRHVLAAMLVEESKDATVAAESIREVVAGPVEHLGAIAHGSKAGSA